MHGKLTQNEVFWRAPLYVLIGLLLPISALAGSLTVKPPYDPGKTSLLKLGNAQTNNTAALSQDRVNAFRDRRKDPALIALQRLMARSKHEKAESPTAYALPSSKGIYTLEANDVIEENEVEALVEDAKFDTLIREASDFQKKRQFDEAAELLLANVDSFTSEKYQFLIYSRIGILFNSIGDFERAAVNLEKAQTLQPNDPGLVANYSAILLGKGDVQKAIDLLNGIAIETLSNKTNLFTIHFNFACAYSLNGKNEEATTHLELAARTDPVSCYASMGDTMLDNIRESAAFDQIKTALERLLRNL